MASLVGQTLLTYQGGRNSLSAEILAHEREAVLRRRGYDTAPMLWKMLIEMLWPTSARCMGLEKRLTEITGGDHALAHGKYWDERISAAQRRYLRAVEALA